jgi:hypothetical protein
LPTDAPSRLTTAHGSRQSSPTRPAQQGPGYVVDYALACNRPATTTSGETLVRPVLEQGGRWFAPRSATLYCAPA